MGGDDACLDSPHGDDFRRTPDGDRLLQPRLRAGCPPGRAAAPPARLGWLRVFTAPELAPACLGRIGNPRLPARRPSAGLVTGAPFRREAPKRTLRPTARNLSRL